MFFEKFKLLCIEKGHAPQSKYIMDKLNISSGSISGWAAGQEPKADTIRKVALFFNCTSDYLLELSDVRNNDIDESEKVILEAFKLTDAQGRARITQVAMNERDRAERERSSGNSKASG